MRRRRKKRKGDDESKLNGSQKFLQVLFAIPYSAPGLNGKKSGYKKQFV